MSIDAAKTAPVSSTSRARSWAARSAVTSWMTLITSSASPVSDRIGVERRNDQRSSPSGSSR
jgi:hypothetical protein